MFGIFNAAFRTATRTNTRNSCHSTDSWKDREEARRRKLEEEILHQLHRPRP